jgi:hypothetical protein
MSARERRTHNPMALQLAEALARAQEKVPKNGPEASALDVLRKEVLGNPPAPAAAPPPKIGRPKEATRRWLETSKVDDTFVEMRGKSAANLYLIANRAGRSIAIQNAILTIPGLPPTSMNVQILKVTEIHEPNNSSADPGAAGNDAGDGGDGTGE